MKARAIMSTAVITLVLASNALAGLCARCEQTCNYTIGTTFTKTYRISGNKNQRQVLTTNPHNDCVAAFNWWCTSSGSVLCYTYQERNYAGQSGKWGMWHGPYNHNTPQC